MLLIVVAAVVAFVCIMALLAGAVLSEHGLLKRIRFDPNAHPFTLSMTDAFDPEHVILWSSQIPALRLIRSVGGRGLSYHRLFRAYQQAAHHYPELYDGSSFAQWLFFLQSAELITMTTYRVRITEYGCRFLDYCVAEVTMAA